METETEEIEDENLIETADGERVPEDETWECEKTGETYSNKVDSITVYVSRRTTEEWCQDAVDSYAFFCQNLDEHYSKSYFTKIEVEGQYVCQEANEENLYYWESDEEYHWEAEPEEDEDEYDIPDYHDEERPWEGKDFGKELVFGCELEVEATDSRVKVKEIANSFGLIGERDGSLDDTDGIEIIGPPQFLEDYSKKESLWLKFLEKVKDEAKGWDAGLGYGMHVSINRKALSDFHTGKLLVFINSNQELCTKIAGRGQTDYQRYCYKTIKDGKKQYGDKYEALAIRDNNRLECRIFRSTLKPSSFLKNIEFVAAAIEFTRFSSCGKLDTDSFKDWLKKNTSSYKNLARKLGVLKENPKKEKTEEES